MIEIHIYRRFSDSLYHAADDPSRQALEHISGAACFHPSDFDKITTLARLHQWDITLVDEPDVLPQARLASMNTAPANRLIAIAKSGECQFWQDAHGQVYRCQPSPPDKLGLPSSRRWECSIEHWNRYREIFGWVEDVV